MVTEQVFSLNPLTGEKHAIPTNLDHSKAIDDFVLKNKDKPIIVVQGLGFVGTAMSLVCANAINGDYAVIGIDLPRPNTYWKIKSINDGHCPIVASDKKIELFFNQAKEKGNFLATYDPYAYSKADTIIVDINLDVQKQSNFEKDLEGFDVDLGPFKKAMSTIGENCKEDVLIIVETTVPPGTCQKVVQPIITEALEKRNLKSDAFKLGHSYERVMPGPNYIDSIQNFYRVFSGIDPKSEVATETFLRTVISTKEYPLTKLSNTNSTEIAKVLENSYRAMNIAFITEWSRFAEEAGADIFEVVHAIRMRPTHKNIMLPGIGVGGYCLPKDPLLASWARQNLFAGAPLGMSEEAVKTNDKLPLYAFEFFAKKFGGKLAGKKVLILGVAYAPDVFDTRYTPVEPFYNYLNKEGCEIILHDPLVSYWEEKRLEIETSFDKILDKEDIDFIVIGTGHKIYRNSSALVNKVATQENIFLFDPIGVFSDENIQKMKNGLGTIKVLGRGNI